MNHRFRRPAIGAALVLLLLAPVGCERVPQGPPQGVVRDRITLDGRPTPHVTITFTDPITQIGINAQTNVNGEYVLKTYKDVGLPPGSYQVAISAASSISDEEIARKMMDSTYKSNTPTTPIEVADAFPTHFASPTTSGLKAEVAAGENPEFNFDLKSKK